MGRLHAEENFKGCTDVRHDGGYALLMNDGMERRDEMMSKRGGRMKRPRKIGRTPHHVGADTPDPSAAIPARQSFNASPTRSAPSLQLLSLTTVNI